MNDGVRCCDCQKVFDSQVSLQSHISVWHCGYLPFKCYTCFVATPSKSVLQATQAEIEEHITSTHNPNPNEFQFIVAIDKRKEEQLSDYMRKSLEVPLETVPLDQCGAPRRVLEPIPIKVEIDTSFDRRSESSSVVVVPTPTVPIEAVQCAPEPELVVAPAPSVRTEPVLSPPEPQPIAPTPMPTVVPTEVVRAVAEPERVAPTPLTSKPKRHNRLSREEGEIEMMLAGLTQPGTAEEEEEPTDNASKTKQISPSVQKKSAKKKRKYEPTIMKFKDVLDGQKKQRPKVDQLKELLLDTLKHSDNGKKTKQVEEVILTDSPGPSRPRRSSRHLGKLPPFPWPVASPEESEKLKRSARVQGSNSQEVTFTDIQKRTLEQLGKEMTNPSVEMLESIAEQLRLSVETVDDYFKKLRCS